MSSNESTSATNQFCNFTCSDGDDNSQCTVMDIIYSHCIAGLKKNIEFQLALHRSSSQHFFACPEQILVFFFSIYLADDLFGSLNILQVRMTGWHFYQPWIFDDFHFLLLAHRGVLIAHITLPFSLLVKVSKTTTPKKHN